MHKLNMRMVTMMGKVRGMMLVMRKDIKKDLRRAIVKVMTKVMVMESQKATEMVI